MVTTWSLSSIKFISKYRLQLCLQLTLILTTIVTCSRGEIELLVALRMHDAAHAHLFVYESGKKIPPFFLNF